MNFTFAVLMSVATATQFGTQTTTNAPDKSVQMMKAFGGFVTRPGMKQGDFAIYNAQDEIDASVYSGIAQTLGKRLQIDVPTAAIRLENCKPETLLKLRQDRNNDFALFVVKNESSHVSSGLFPDQRIGYVNIAALRTGRGESKAFFNARIRKEIVRSFLSLCGASTSLTGVNVMSPIKCLDELDDVKESAIPMDVISRVYNNLPRIGCNNRAKTTYLKACQEGWAPAPTNEYQKAIWDRVHAAPSKPIKITYDKDKQKPVVK